MSDGLVLGGQGGDGEGAGFRTGVLVSNRAGAAEQGVGAPVWAVRRVTVSATVPPLGGRRPQALRAPIQRDRQMDDPRHRVPVLYYPHHPWSPARPESLP